ncbi:MAG TPA: TetR/AcrR family transcriptional regulator C-terminal domain-containing protein [Streptosporangiaceae bacterium]
MPGKLSKPAIVQAALDVLDESGIDGVTVRAVAARLGVKAAALYWHVRDKQELLDEMGTEIWRRVSAEIAALPDGEPWDVTMTAVAGIIRRALLSHRDGAKVFTGTYLTDTSVLEAQEAGLARMTQQGFTVEGVVQAYMLVYNFTVGFCIEEQAVAQAIASGDERYSLDHRAGRLDSEAHSRVIEAGPAIFGDAGQRFDRLIGLIIDTGRRLLTASAQQPA